MQLELDISKSIEKNAEFYYEHSKKAKKKLAGAEKSIEETQNKIKKLEIKEVNISNIKPTVKRNKQWYEKYRWFISSTGLIVIGGRDATTNDIIIKKHLEKNDIVFHTDIAGSPFVVVKAGKNDIDNETINEAAQFCASYSRAWQHGVTITDVYFVRPEQVKKELGLPKGTFMIYGKRTYQRPVLGTAIGITTDDAIMGGPLSAVKKNCRAFVEVIQGDVKKSDCAKKIKAMLEKAVKHAIDLDEIMQTLPPGDCRIKP